MNDYTSKEKIRESAKDIFDHIYGFIPNSEQYKAINARDYMEARRLGVSLDQYLYLISPNYKSQICELMHV
jgi:hypothetical protein